MTLIGMPVARSIVASLDYTRSVTRSGWNFYRFTDAGGVAHELTSAANSGLPGFVKFNSITAPDITFYPAGSASVPASSFELDLARVGPPGERFVLTNLAFRHQGYFVSDADPVTAPTLPYLFDTGTNITIVGDQIAGMLHLVAGGGSFNCLGGTSNGYVLDAITAVAAGGAYVVNSANVCWQQNAILDGGARFSAVIGSNLFDQVRIVLDGPRNKLGVGPVAPSPVFWQPAPRNYCTTTGGPVVVSLAVSIADPNLTLGQQIQATAVATDNLGSDFALPAIWSSSNTAVATVSANGLVTAVGPGFAAIVAHAAGLTAAAQVSVGTVEGSHQPSK
ncbi:MAG: Ig-like domain-containing protein [Gemmatimonadaceae bacterium]|nr:Ig-like domain-containing protein [Gemmatimonadaceae bacterium]